MWPTASLWTPWSQSNALTLLATAHEKTILDLKQQYDLTKPDTKFEIAKDLAAFANAFGGTVLVGAVEGTDTAGRKNGRCVAFLTISNSGPLIKQVTDSARDHCRPPIVVAPEEIRLTPAEAGVVLRRPHPDPVTLLAINISPLFSGPAGVFAIASDGKSKASDAFRFPVRIGEGTTLLMPEELAFHMNSHERRILLSLQQVGTGCDVLVWSKALRPEQLKQSRAFKLKAVDPELQIAVLQPLDGPNKLTTAHVPLTFMRAVWRDASGAWQLDVDGSVCDTQSNIPFVPRGGDG